MKIPKFRAWVKAEKRMIKVCEIGYAADKIHFIRDENYSFYLVDEIELMQSTGLKDKNGKEVYENDIIKDSEDFIAQVVYNEEYVGFGLNYNTANLIDSFDVTFEELKNEYQNTFEIIGNIYENKDLLGE